MLTLGLTLLGKSFENSSRRLHHDLNQNIKKTLEDSQREVALNRWVLEVGASVKFILNRFLDPNTAKESKLLRLLQV